LTAAHIRSVSHPLCSGWRVCTRGSGGRAITEWHCTCNSQLNHAEPDSTCAYSVCVLAAAPVSSLMRQPCSYQMVISLTDVRVACLGRVTQCAAAACKRARTYQADVEWPAHPPHCWIRICSQWAQFGGEYHVSPSGLTRWRGRSTPPERRMLPDVRLGPHHTCAPNFAQRMLVGQACLRCAAAMCACH
jgi:hypothetical protein